MKSCSQILHESITDIPCTNTTTLNDGSKIKITIVNGLPRFDHVHVYSVAATFKGRSIGTAEFYEEWRTVEEVIVKPKYQRIGVATAMYDMIEKVFDIKIKTSSRLTPDGRAFWNNRSKPQEI